MHRRSEISQPQSTKEIRRTSKENPKRIENTKENPMKMQNPTKVIFVMGVVEFAQQQKLVKSVLATYQISSGLTKYEVDKNVKSI